MRRLSPDESLGGTMKRLDLPLEYDSKANMAYLTFSEISRGEQVGPDRTVHVELPRWAHGGLVIDFDAEGRIVGMEFLNVSSQFRLDLVERLRAARDDARPTG